MFNLILIQANAENIEMHLVPPPPPAPIIEEVYAFDMPPYLFNTQIYF